MSGQASLVYSTHLGGSGFDNDTDLDGDLALDSSGGIYITGTTRSSGFPVTLGAWKTVRQASDAFLLKIDPTKVAAEQIVWSTFVGGTSNEHGFAVTADNIGSVWVGGSTVGSGFPVTPNAFQASANAAAGFIARFSGDGANLDYGSYIGGGGGAAAEVLAMAVGQVGDVYATGQAGSSDFPTTAGAIQPTDPGSLSGFVLKMPASAVIANSPPVADAGGPYSVGEGSTTVLNGSGSSDPDNDIQDYEWDYDYGGATFDVDATGVTPTFSAAGLDGPLTRTVALRVRDTISQDSIDTATLNVVNRVPVLTVDDTLVVVDEADTAINKGELSDPGGDTLTLFASPGTAVDNRDGTWSWTYDTTDGPDETVNVSITATDNDGATSTVRFDLTVNNVQPDVTVNTSPVGVDEGQQAINAGTFSDPGADTVTMNASIGRVLDNGNETWSWTFDTTDGPDESQLVSIMATDSDGAASTARFDLTVNNVVPVVDAGQDQTIDEGDTLIAPGTFTDPGADTWTATVDYGEGDGLQTLALTGRSFRLSKHYEQAGRYTATVCVTDDDGGTGCDSLGVTVNSVVRGTDIIGALGAGGGVALLFLDGTQHRATTIDTDGAFSFTDVEVDGGQRIVVAKDAQNGSLILTTAAPPDPNARATVIELPPNPSDEHSIIFTTEVRGETTQSDIVGAFLNVPSQIHPFDGSPRDRIELESNYHLTLIGDENITAVFSGNITSTFVDTSLNVGPLSHLKTDPQQMLFQSIAVHEGGRIVPHAPRVPIDLKVGTLTVDPGGLISADGYGEFAGNGSGAGGPLAGGGHGGRGGNSGSGSGGGFYDSGLLPKEFGSSGGGVHGGRGGGLIRIAAAGTVSLMGTISASGFDAGALGGGGAGGTIRIKAHALTGSGVLRANGGNGGFGTPAGQNGGGGGGGRIAVRVKLDNFAEATGIQAEGGVAGSSFVEPGGRGTVAFIGLDDAANTCVDDTRQDDRTLRLYRSWRWEKMDVPFQFQSVVVTPDTTVVGTEGGVTISADTFQIMHTARWFTSIPSTNGGHFVIGGVKIDTRDMRVHSAFIQAPSVDWRVNAASTYEQIGGQLRAGRVVFTGQQQTATSVSGDFRFFNTVVLSPRIDVYANSVDIDQGSLFSTDGQGYAAGEGPRPGETTIGPGGNYFGSGAGKLIANGGNGANSVGGGGSGR